MDERGERVGRPAPLQFPGNKMLEVAGGSSVLMDGITCFLAVAALILT